MMEPSIGLDIAGEGWQQRSIFGSYPIQNNALQTLGIVGPSTRDPFLELGWAMVSR